MAAVVDDTSALVFQLTTDAGRAVTTRVVVSNITITAAAGTAVVIDYPKDESVSTGRFDLLFERRFFCM